MTSGRYVKEEMLVKPDFKIIDKDKVYLLSKESNILLGRLVKVKTNEVKNEENRYKQFLFFLKKYKAT